MDGIENVVEHTEAEGEVTPAVLPEPAPAPAPAEEPAPSEEPSRFNPGHVTGKAS